MQLRTMNTFLLVMTAYLFTYIDGLSVFHKILKDEDYSKKQYWPGYKSIDKDIDLNNNKKRAYENIPEDSYSNGQSNDDVDHYEKELNSKLNKIGALYPYYTQTSKDEDLNSGTTSDFKRKIIHCLNKIPDDEIIHQIRRTCDNVFQCFSSLTGVSQKFGRSLTIAVLPRCNDDVMEVKSKRGPWAGAARRYDSILDRLRSKMSERKRSNPMSKRGIYQTKNHKLAGSNDFPFDIHNTESNNNGINVKGYGHLPLSWLKSLASRTRNNKRYNFQNGADDEGRFEFRHNKVKRMPENVADGGDSIYPFTDGTIGDFANDLALDTYASMLQQEYREARADGTGDMHSNRHIRPFVG